jgi:anti-anti-sigma regulatory factor
LRGYLQKDIPHIILNLSAVQSIEEKAAPILADLQYHFYENNCSFVICSLQKPVEDVLDRLEVLEMLNVTPTETEAWDIVQMEEIERELTGGDDEL